MFSTDTYFRILFPTNERYLHLKNTLLPIVKTMVGIAGTVRPQGRGVFLRLQLPGRHAGDRLQGQHVPRVEVIRLVPTEQMTNL